ncbi:MULTISPECIES: DNA-3-methyladenine glycosylase [Gordonia]|jgi:DNA-3-methyladenine glycosylase|nr:MULTISPECIES: DNA-3-methyladenine glycosylase [Gordonia]MBD0024612.1 DNA-3-methyladenine glycosylase [Gordonia sp. (in: high G+C Gram-positive bacteria)]
MTQCGVDVDALRDSDPVTAASRVLGAILTVGEVVARIVEVEAYGSPANGPWPDPAAHSYPGPTPRNRVMFGPPGVLYVYLSYGIHRCMNVVCGPEDTACAVLLRSAEIIEGADVVTARRPGARRAADLARGPGNLGRALGIELSDNGTELFDPASPIRLELRGVPSWAAGPRVGISEAADRPWRLWFPDSPAVSTYRRSPRATPPDTGVPA